VSLQKSGVEVQVPYCPESCGKAYRFNGANTAIKAQLKSHGINKDRSRQERAKRPKSIIDTAQELSEALER
jgi:hypothetical protein